MNAAKHSITRRLEATGTGLVALILILLVPASACAGPRHHGEWRRAPERRCVVKDLPRHCEATRVGHRLFYYHRGTFYQRAPRGFLTVRAPIGAFVSSLPPRCSLYVSGRDTFYISLGVAYQRCHRGYRVVERPIRLRSRHPLRHGGRHRHSFSYRGRPGWR